MAKEKVFIVVKTYPVISKKYKELACTAGFREDGSWIRLYPLPFRFLNNDKHYKKYQWIEVDIEHSQKDSRPESYKVVNIDTMRLLDCVGTGKNHDWAERRHLILDRNKIYINKKEIIRNAHANKLSLVIFKPKKIVDFIIKESDPDWPPDKLQTVLEEIKQGHLFDEQKIDDFRPVKKLPYKFSYRFLDDQGKESTLMIEDWEIGALYWRYEKSDGAEKAKEKVYQKYMDDLALTKDLYFFLGTTHEWHKRKAPNPYVIIGTFHPPYEKQGTLF